MKQKIFYAFFIGLLMVSYILVYAGGDGGSGCSKNCGNNGGGSGTNQNVWFTATIARYTIVAAPAGLQNDCINNALGAAYGTGYGNSFPNLTSQYLGGTGEYLSQMAVQDLVTGEIRLQEYYPWSSTMPMQVPRYHPYRMTITHYDPCSQCMHPSVINLTTGEGRRVIWKVTEEFPATNGSESFVNSPVTIYYSGLASCN
jgi:hypothetical protein